MQALSGDDLLLQRRTAQMAFTHIGQSVAVIVTGSLLCACAALLLLAPLLVVHHVAFAL